MPASKEMLVSNTSKLGLGVTAASLLLGATSGHNHHQTETIPHGTVFFDSPFPSKEEVSLSKHARTVKRALKHARLEKEKREEREHSYAAPPDSATAPTASVTSYAISGCGENMYSHYIYNYESTCNPKAVNSRGCVGIGQDCNGELRAACPGLDYACEDAFFTNYATQRYGGWEAAYAHEQAYGWW